MKDMFSKIKAKLSSLEKRRIVFPEYEDERVLRAANRLAEENIITPIYIGEAQSILAYANKLEIALTHYEIINPQTFASLPNLAELLIERRSHRISRKEAFKKLQETHYFATMLVYTDYADGLVSGASHTTSAAILPALQIIKPKKQHKKISGAYILIRNHERYIFSDCAININPTSEELAEITLQSAQTAELLQWDPKIAMLSFSTKGSAHSTETSKIIEAVQLVKRTSPSLKVDGEVQFDAAYMPELAAKKSADSIIKGDANVFVFPNLEAGNISCKIAERLGGFQAIGPIMQGLNRPVNLLSRGCSEDDVYKVALFTALQAEILKAEGGY